MPYTQVCVHLVITWSIILLIANLLTPLGAAVNVLIAATASFSVMKYRERALAMIEKKVEGQEIKAVAPAPRPSGQVVNIFAALKNNDISKLASKRKIRVRSFSRAK